MRRLAPATVCPSLHPAGWYDPVRRLKTLHRHVAAVSCDAMPGHAKWYGDHCEISTTSVVRRRHIDQSARLAIRLQWVWSDLKLRSSVASLISHAQPLERVAVCSQTWNCTTRSSDKSFRPVPPDEAALRANRLPLVHLWHNPTSPAQYLACVSVWTSRAKYCVDDTNRHAHNDLETMAVPPRYGEAPVFGCNERRHLRLVCKQIHWRTCQQCLVNA